MAELLSLNNNPLNQRCLALLRQLDQQEPPSPGHLYSLQLALWGLEKLQLPPPSDQYQADLLEQGQVMLGWDPANAQSFLVPVSGRGENWEAGEDYLGHQEDPEQAAARLVGTFVGNLQQEYPILGHPTEELE